jgi:hypothetical protein
MTRYKPIILIILAAFLVLTLISFLVITSPNRTLTTPGLIERAFNRGEINAEQRVLYLTYAIYEYKSLPKKYWGKVPWRGTSTVMDISEAIHPSSKFCSMSPYTQSELRRLLRSLTDTICE